jgi:hypothetical protein
VPSQDGAVHLDTALVAQHPQKNYEFNSSCRNVSFTNPKQSVDGNFNWIKSGGGI